MSTLEELIQQKKEIADKIRDIQSGKIVDEDLKDLDEIWEFLNKKIEDKISEMT